MIVGRTVVLATANAALHDALGGHGRLLVLAGEAGIGKTTIARTLAQRAVAAGASVRWGACWEVASLVPFAAWSQALRAHTDDACTDIARRLDEGAFDAVAPDERAAAQQRLRFFVDVVDALRATSADQPLVIVLEDIHWADPHSLDLLRAVTSHLATMPVLAVATYRDDESTTARVVSGLGGAVDTITLEGLQKDEVAVLLAELLGRNPSGDEVDAVFARTAGNPLFVTHVGRLVASGSPTVLPGGVREVLARRLARLSAGSARVLGVAAVLGTDFRASVLSEVLGRPRDETLRALDEAEAARLLAHDTMQSDHWSFAHALVAETCYDALGRSERQRWHRRVIDVLYAGSRSSPGVLAHHVARGQFEPEDPRPTQVMVNASRDALARLAWHDAARLAEQACMLAPAGDAEARVEALLALGDARLRCGDIEAAADAFAAASAVVRTRDAPDLLARAALGFAAGLGSFEVRVFDRRQLELLEEAAAALPADAPLRPFVLARLSVALSLVGSEDRRLALADAAVDAARAHDDARALAAALAARCDAQAGPDHVAARLDAAAEIVVLAQQSNDRALELLGRRLKVCALLELRDEAGFDTEVAAYERVALRLADPLYGWYVPLWRAMRAHAAGRFAEAERCVDEATAMGTAASSVHASMLPDFLRLFAAIDRRDHDEVEQRRNALTALDPQFSDVAVQTVLAFIDARMRAQGPVGAGCSRLGAGTLALLPKDQEWLTSLCQFVVAAVTNEDREATRRVYEVLLPYEGLGVFEGIAAYDHGVVDRFLALAAGHLDDAEAAVRHTERALVRVAGAGALVIANTRADCARGLLATTDEDARARGRGLASETAAAYEDLGLAGPAQELRGCEGSPLSRAALVREGDTWTFAFAGETTRLRHAKGVADLAQLLSQPGRAVHVRTLEGVAAPGTTVQPVLDDAAADGYRARLAALEADLAEAEDNADIGRSASIAAERDALIDQLTAAYGLGGRKRGFSDPDDRLRKAVSARIKASIDRIESQHASLGRHLRRSVRTGFLCTYEPEPTVDWHVQLQR